MSTLSERALKVVERTRGENDNLNTVIAALVGALHAKQNVQELDILEEDIFVDSDPANTSEAKLHIISFDEKGRLFFTDNEDEEDGSVENLPLNTRLELVEKLAGLLEA